MEESTRRSQTKRGFGSLLNVLSWPEYEGGDPLLFVVRLRVFFPTVGQREGLIF